MHRPQSRPMRPKEERPKLQCVAIARHNFGFYLTWWSGEPSPEDADQCVRHAGKAFSSAPDREPDPRRVP